ncbi:MAG: hypothetical protein ACRBN8_30025 [Nannocystales bacterium]
MVSKELPAFAMLCFLGGCGIKELKALNRNCEHSCEQAATCDLLPSALGAWAGHEDRKDRGDEANCAARCQASVASDIRTVQTCLGDVRVGDNDWDNLLEREPSRCSEAHTCLQAAWGENYAVPAELSVRAAAGEDSSPDGLDVTSVALGVGSPASEVLAAKMSQIGASQFGHSFRDLGLGVYFPFARLRGNDRAEGAWCRNVYGDDQVLGAGLPGDSDEVTVKYPVARALLLASPTGCVYPPSADVFYACENDAAACSNGGDDDCDGFVDCLDTDCADFCVVDEDSAVDGSTTTPGTDSTSSTGVLGGL